MTQVKRRVELSTLSVGDRFEYNDGQWTVESEMDAEEWVPITTMEPDEEYRHWTQQLWGETLVTITTELRGKQAAWEKVLKCSRQANTAERKLAQAERRLAEAKAAHARYK